MDLNLVEDDEQEKAKQWWKENRVPIISGIALGIAIIAGFNWWEGYQRGRAADASNLYQQLLNQDSDGDRTAAIETGNRLLADFDDTPYSGKAALVLARISYENKDKQAAVERLNWVIENSAQFESKHAARLKLANLYMADKNYQQALDVLSVVHMEGFESHYFELRGDIYRHQGQHAKARDAYRAAIDGLAAGSMYEPVLRMKLDSSPAGEDK